MRVAVVGAGAAGLAAALALSANGTDLIVYESESIAGGHCVGVAVDGVDIDVGVSDFNAKRFLRFAAILKRLGLTSTAIGQDASFSLPNGHATWWVNRGKPTFAAPSPTDLDFLAAITRFNHSALEAADDPRFEAMRASTYLSRLQLGEREMREWFAPRAGGSFPMPERNPADYLVRPMVAFWRMHGIVGLAGERRVIDGGMARWPPTASRCKRLTTWSSTVPKCSCPRMTRSTVRPRWLQSADSRCPCPSSRSCR